MAQLRESLLILFGVLMGIALGGSVVAMDIIPSAASSGSGADMQQSSFGFPLAAQLAVPIVLGIVGFIFTRSQVEIARNKLRLDHFDKRFAVFDAARQLLARAVTRGEVTTEGVNAFLKATQGATFLFEDQGVKAYLDLLLRRVEGLSLSQALLRQSSSAGPDPGTAQKICDDMQWMSDQYEAIESVFRPHLQLKA
jgi:hypothetical protein